MKDVTINPIVQALWSMTAAVGGVFLGDIFAGWQWGVYILAAFLALVVPVIVWYKRKTDF